MEPSVSAATREIMWNIPSSFKVSMYSFLIISVCIFFYGMSKHLKFIIGNGKIFGQSGLIPSFSYLNIKNFFQTIFFLKKLARNHYAGLMHALIYYGFLILWIATDVVAIHYDTPFKIFQGPVYIIISLLADLAGMMMIMGIILASYRRYFKKEKKLSATNPNSEKIMYSTLLALVILGYLIEALRIVGTGMPIGEKSWAPVGYAIAVVIKAFNFSDSSLGLTYRIFWFAHMVNTMVFLAIIPYTKFLHMFIIPLNALLSKDKQGAILSPMNFEDEEAESFGLSKLSEMTMKNRMDLLSCVECGRCTEVCPALHSGKNLNPKTIITKARDLAQSDINSNVEFWGDKPIYESNELDACTTCGACMEECPANIEHVNIIMEAKRYKALTLGDIPPSAADAINKIKINGNPWGLSQDERFKWSEGLDVPVISPDKKVDYLYYIGCAGSYDAENQKVVKNTIALLKSANVDFAVLGKSEKCNGDPIRRFGDEYSFYEVAVENIEHLNQYDFKMVVTHCPHCLHTIGKEYGKFDSGKFKTIHHSELLAQLIKNGQLKPKNPINSRMTFHDPCYLGRHHGDYSSPRQILEAIPGISIKEMEKSKDKSRCCGMGGGNMWYELPDGEDLAIERLKDISSVRPEQLATACSYCMINFNSSKSTVEGTKEVEINDVASILAKSVLD